MVPAAEGVAVVRRRSEDERLSDGRLGEAMRHVVSARSVAGESVPLEFPDFTKGKWKTAKPFDVA